MLYSAVILIEVQMKSHTYYHVFQTQKKREYIRVTDIIEEQLAASGIKEGLCLVSAMHITAAVYVNDAESGLLQDIEEWLQKLAPEGPDYKHHRTGEVNGDAHLKNLLLHNQTVLPVTDGKLDLGPWQEIYYAEFDGRRKKRMIVKIIGE